MYVTGLPGILQLTHSCVGFLSLPVLLLLPVTSAGLDHS
jgi:hypothetical protein